MSIAASSIETDRTEQTVSRIHPADLISQLLNEQSNLSAVDEFSKWHQIQAEPAQALYYRNLLPSSMPGAGQQLAFEVDLDKCSGCKACVVACHSLNGLDEGESFRDVGLLLSTTANEPQFQHVTTACHHCIDPGCLNACPVNAYEKDVITGIVRHLDDQCFGCQYCTLACPYEVPKYHAAKGIVRKCDMCTQRLSVGEAPACVQACPHQAIRIQVVEKSSAHQNAAAGIFLPDSPDPNITIPTTRFIGKTTSIAAMKAGTYSVRPLEHTHWPLVVLLVFSQIAVGMESVASIIRLENAHLRTVVLSVAAILAVVSAMSSTLHLGRPRFAYRAILGIRHSWLSREIAAFGLFIPLCFSSAGLSWLNSDWLTLCTFAAALIGIAGMTASMMVYHVTHRPFWNAKRVVLSFATTACGSGTIIVLWILQISSEESNPGQVRVLAGIVAFCYALKTLMLRNLMTGHQTGSSLIRRNPQTRPVFHGQMMGNIAATLASLLQIVWPAGPLAMSLATITLCSSITTEFIERYLFFRAVVPLQMPGVMKQ